MKQLLIAITALFFAATPVMNTVYAENGQMCCDCCKTGKCACKVCRCCDCAQCPACSKK